MAHKPRRSLRTVILLVALCVTLWRLPTLEPMLRGLTDRMSGGSNGGAALSSVKELVGQIKGVQTASATTPEGKFDPNNLVVYSPDLANMTEEEKQLLIEQALTMRQPSATGPLKKNPMVRVSRDETPRPPDTVEPEEQPAKPSKKN